MGILFGHFSKYCCGHNTCEKRVSLISTFPQPSQVVGSSFDFLPLLLISSQTLFFLQFTFLKSFLCSLYCEINSKVFSAPREALHSLDNLDTFYWTRRFSGKKYVIILALPTILLLRAEYQLFRNQKSSQLTNAYSHHSLNYPYSGLIPNKRTPNLPGI